MKEKNQIAIRRARRVRAVIRGTSVAPRLTVKRSSKHIYAQLIDDVVGKTIASASDKDIKDDSKPMVIAKEVGKILAERAKDKKINKAVFDRGPYRYHGRVAALADGARENGLEF